MSLFKIALEMLSKELAEQGEDKLEDVLQKVHDEDGPEEYKAAIYGGHVFCKKIKKFTDSTKTRIDDGIVNAIHEAIHDSADKNGLDLND